MHSDGASPRLRGERVRGGRGEGMTRPAYALSDGTSHHLQGEEKIIG